jgi:hypothetical protein
MTSMTCSKGLPTFALMEFYERHLRDTAGTPIALFPIRDMGNLTWSEGQTAACHTACQTYHVGWVLTGRYTRHMSSLLQEVTTVGAYQCMRLEEYNHKVEAKDRLIAELRKGNRELLQQTHTLERRNKELHDDLLCTYRSLNFKTDTLNSTHTLLQHTQDKLTSAQSYC